MENSVTWSFIAAFIDKRHHETFLRMHFSHIRLWSISYDLWLTVLYRTGRNISVRRIFSKRVWFKVIITTTIITLNAPSCPSFAYDTDNTLGGIQYYNRSLSAQWAVGVLNAFIGYGSLDATNTSKHFLIDQLVKFFLSIG